MAKKAIEVTSENIGELAAKMDEVFGEYTRSMDSNAQGVSDKGAIPEQVIEDLASTCRKIALAIISFSLPKEERPSYYSGAKLAAQVVARRVGSQEALSRFGMDPQPEMVVGDPRELLPSDLFGRRTYEFAQGWEAAKNILDSYGDNEITQQEMLVHHDIENSYAPQTFSGSEFTGGWNEYIKRNA
jgi:hypothetical protein